MKKVDFVLVIFGVIGLVLLISIFLILKSEGTECLQNGFLYGANHQIGGGGIIECSCYQTVDNKVLPFKFNNTDLTIIPVNQPLFPELENVP